MDDSGYPTHCIARPIHSYVSRSLLDFESLARNFKGVTLFRALVLR